jgi:hypothetical protein
LLQELFEVWRGAGAPPWYRDPLVTHFLLAAAALWPLMRLMRRAGLRPAWALLMLVPMVGPALVGTALVFQRWPTVPSLPRRRRR